MKNLKRRVSVIICIMLAFMLVSCNLKKEENKEAQKNNKNYRFLWERTNF